MFETPDDVRAYWQTTIDGPGTINMNGSGDIEVKMIKADTIEKLVEELGLPKEETLKTIEAYNGYCDKGVDEEFGKRKELLLPVRTARSTESNARLGSSQLPAASAATTTCR